MARKVIDCRDQPNELNCSLTLVGEENEVIDAAVMHATSSHGYPDTPELRDHLRQGMKDVGDLGPDEASRVA